MRRVLMAATAAAVIGIATPASAAVQFASYNGPDLTPKIKASTTNTQNDNSVVYGCTQNDGACANVTFTGQTLTTSIAQVATLTPGALTFTGQTLNATRTSQLTPGTLSFGGQSLTTSVARIATVTPGALLLAGQTLAVQQLLVAALTPGAVVFTGQMLTAGLAAAPVNVITYEGPLAGGAPSGVLVTVSRKGPG